VTFTAAATALSAVLTGLVDAAADASSLTSPAELAAWQRMRSYVNVSAEAGKLRLTAAAAGQEFTVTLTAPVGNTATAATVASPSTTTMNVGFYVAIDRTKGVNGFNAQGQPYIKSVEASTAGADIIGPVYLGQDTEPVNPGFAFREYAEGSNVPIVRHGPVVGYAEEIIPGADLRVYVRHTAGGDFLPGMAASATAAAAGATANVWTGTPTAANDTVYQQQIVYGSAIEVLTYLSDGTATDQEICDGLRAQLALRNGVGGPLEGITGSGTTTLILTGPADGRGFTPSSIGVGSLAWVETTPEVATHILHPRGDRFGAPSIRVGPAPIRVPVTV
jgi:hypothetical protein